MNTSSKKVRHLVSIVAVAQLAHVTVRADVVTDWNVLAADIVFAAGMPVPPAKRALASVQTAVYEAVNAITKRYPADRVTLNAAPGASIEAAVAAANRAALAALAPSQRAAIGSWNVLPSARRRCSCRLRRYGSGWPSFAAGGSPVTHGPHVTTAESRRATSGSP